MDIGRRKLVRSAGLILGCTLGPAGLVGAQGGRDNRKQVNRREYEEIIREHYDGPRFTCVQTSELTEGPFYYESSLERRALAEDRDGVPLRLGITLGGITPSGACMPLRGAVIDVWHTDATGLYSNVAPDLQPVDTTGQTFLRGHQLTDDNGYVEFDTIVPCWEILAAPPPINVDMRTTHIHVKVYHGRDVLTTQLFFPDSMIDDLYANTEPYKSHRLLTAPGLDRAYPRIRNGEDRFFARIDARPMAVERVNGVLTAQATIGMISRSMGNRGIQPLFR